MSYRAFEAEYWIARVDELEDERDRLMVELNEEYVRRLKAEAERDRLLAERG